MATFPQSFVDAHEAKLSACRAKPDAKPVDAFEWPEEELCQMIIKECQRRRWYFQRNIPGRRSTATKGSVDFVICGPGITFFVEVKKKGNKLSEDQVITRHILTALLQNWACVYSFQQFIDFVEERTNPTKLE